MTEAKKKKSGKFSIEKGKRAEREIYKMLNAIVIDTRAAFNLPPLDDRDLPFQRDQNQSAVGGSDIRNPFGISIEVKDHAQMSINTWWKQCIEAAERTNTIPVLVYKNGTGPNRWHFVMRGAYLPRPQIGELLPNPVHHMNDARVTMHADAFLEYMRHVIDDYYEPIAKLAHAV